jgi:DNA repair protein RecO (recombination protein O)
MEEHFTKALILAQENIGESDRRIIMFAEDLGKVSAKAKSARKIISKLAGHLEPLSFSNVRMIEKGGFQLTDALSIAKAPKTGANAEFLEFLKDMTFELQPDRRLWAEIKKTLFRKNAEEKISYREILKIIGFDPKFARCFACQSESVIAFSKTEQDFLCKAHALKVPRNEIILI